MAINDYLPARWDESVTARFWSKVDRRSDSECWEWLGTLTPKGYGQFSIDGKHYAAHRLLVVKQRGDNLADLVCDHRCRNRRCVNPAHIEPVPNRENIVRGLGPRVLTLRNRAKTHCPRGHAYTPDNVRLDRKGSRNCRACAKTAYFRAKLRAHEVHTKETSSEDD